MFFKIFSVTLKYFCNQVNKWCDFSTSLGKKLMVCLSVTEKQSLRRSWCFRHSLYTDGSAGKESACRAGDTGDVGLIPGFGRSPGGGNDNPFQYSCLGNPMDRGAWQAKVHGVTENWTGQCTCIHTHTRRSWCFRCSFYREILSPKMNSSKCNFLNIYF